MAHIKEPKGIDFLIQSPPLTEQERKEISDLINKLKSDKTRKRIIRKRKSKKEIVE